MKLVTKLLDYVHDAFNKEPDSFVALRVRHTSEAFSWQVSERTLTLYDNLAILHTIDLTQYTLQSLVSYLAGLGGITIVYADTDRIHISASSLIDGAGYQAQSNGDILLSYQSTLWMYLDALATELVDAKNRIIAMLDQLSIKTADDEWLDEWGGYFGVYREAGETDSIYSNRIIAEVIKPRGNNKAIEAALLQKYGQYASVVDITKYGTAINHFDGTHLNNGAINYDSSQTTLYGLFSIVVGYDLLTSGSPPAFIQSVRDFIEKIRDAGTHLDSVILTGSEMSDTLVSAPVDSGLDLTISQGAHYNGTYTHNGAISYGAIVSNESL